MVKLCQFYFPDTMTSQEKRPSVSICRQGSYVVEFKLRFGSVSVLLINYIHTCSCCEAIKLLALIFCVQMFEI